MLIFSKYQQMYVFIHIPKNSGKYIKKQLFDKFKCYNLAENCVLPINPLLPPALTTNIYSGKFPHFNYKQILRSKADFTDITPDAKYIAFTRNPYDKFISGYFYILNNRTVGITDISIEKLKNLTMIEFINILVEGFRDYIKNRLVALFNENNLLMQPQYTFITDETGNIPHDLTIYKLEDYETNAEAQELFQLENFNLKRYNYAEYYDDKCLAIINEVYKKDFELLGYSRIENINKLN
jgi:hypothetical protein